MFKKAISLIIVLTLCICVLLLLVGCFSKNSHSLENNDTDISCPENSNQDYELPEEEYIVYMQLPEKHWSFDVAWKGFCDAADSENVKVEKVIYNTSSYDSFFAPLFNHVNTGKVCGIYTYNLEIGLLDCFEEIPNEIPVLTRLSCSPDEVCFEYPATTDILYYTLPDKEEFLIGIEYIRDNYDKNTRIGCIYGDTPDNFKKVKYNYYGLNDEYIVNDYLNIYISGEGDKVSEYVVDNDVDVLLVDNFVHSSLLKKCSADIIYVGTDKGAIEMINSGNVKAVIAHPIYEYGRKAFYDLMCAVKGLEYPNEVLVEPIIIDSSDEAKEYLSYIK